MIIIILLLCLLNLLTFLNNILWIKQIPNKPRYFYFAFTSYVNGKQNKGSTYFSTNNSFPNRLTLINTLTKELERQTNCNKNCIEVYLDN